ncbi:MAG: DUF4412 domain-containing protein [Thermoanaerobaculaceae bacterium]|nr:DUF4412 domain-containing protein [Thermoanaerobaculaceae bacterium]TAM48785.1 MAG: DUF4412 domain-containing protein [Acidobacteriota bacterium]
MRKLSVLAVLILLVAGVPSYAGVYYTAKTTADGGRGAAAQDATVQAWVSGDSAKVVFESSGNPMMSKGMYMVTKDGGKVVYMVNPEEKSYFKWDMDSLMGMAGGMMKMMNMTYTDPKVEKIAEEPDGLVAGVPTIHYKFHTSYTLSMSMMMMKKKMHVVKDEEIWAAPKLVEAGLGIWLRKTPPKTNNEQLDALIKAEMGKVEGFPLKTRMVQTSTDEKGKVETTTTTMEVTDLRMQVVPASTFEIPPGYKETSMMGGEKGEKGEETNPFLKMMGQGKKNPN